MHCQKCGGHFHDSEVKTWNGTPICPRCEPYKGQMRGHHFVCWCCGRGPTEHVSFVAAIGRVVDAVEERYEGWFCRDCGLALFDKVMKRHVANTSSAYRTLGMGANMVERNKLLKLAPPQPIQLPS
jgi:hypothetical protein